MMTFLKVKLTAVLISALAVTTVAGTAVVAAAHHAGPFAPGAVFGAQKMPTAADNHQNFHAQGLIQTVTFATGATTSGTLTLVPNGQSQSVIIAITAQTHVEVNDASEGRQAGSTTSGSKTRGAAALAAGQSANVVGTLQHDGTVLAREIQANTNGKAHQGGNGHAGDKHDFTGTVQAVDFTAMTFVLLPAGQTQPVTIAFDTTTKIEAHGNLHGATALIVGVQVQVHAITRSDGTLYATALEVQTGDHGVEVTPTPGGNGHKP